MEFLSKRKWLNMSEEEDYKKVLKCANGTNAGPSGRAV